jgi:thioester reductase-like protein
LLQDTGATLYCLVRAKSGQQAWSRVKTTLQKWDLWRDEFERRIIPVPGDLSLPWLGLDESTYQSLSRTIDSIYHCGTSMNHLETYEMAKPANVGGVRELLKIATQQKPKLINYISSLGIFNSTSAETSRVVDEESSIEREKHRVSSGYTASKWVGEKMFMTAAERGIPCNIFRLGLVWADTQLGRYDELQREYRIFKTCLLSGCGIKKYQCGMAPIPVDYVARAVVFLANQHSCGQGIFHIGSPRSMTVGVYERCNEIAELSLELMPFYEWICEVKRLHNEGRSLPAVPLIEFAFSMDKESFDENQRHTIGSGQARFDFARTHRELEHGGIVAPVMNDALLKVFLDGMFSRDAELREWTTLKAKHLHPNHVITQR